MMLNVSRTDSLGYICLPLLTCIYPETIVTACLSNAVSSSIKAFWKADFTEANLFVRLYYIELLQ